MYLSVGYSYSLSLKSNFFKFFAELVFKQTAKELGVPFFVAGNNTDNNLAAISRILNAPVLANDTIFCAYHLDAGWIYLNDFVWKKASLFS